MSIKTAKSYSYPFDKFIGVDLRKPDELIEAIGVLADAIERIIRQLEDAKATPATVQT